MRRLNRVRMLGDAKSNCNSRGVADALTTWAHCITTQAEHLVKERFKHRDAWASEDLY